MAKHDGEETLTTDELIRQMELDELEDRAFEVTKIKPREYGMLRGIAPQLVYYHIRQGRIKKETCICGSSVIDIDSADEYFKKGKYADGQASEE